MSFYSEFSNYYESVFPFKSETFSFLKSYINVDGANILDAGCGTGHYIGKFADTAAKAYGIDIDVQMIDYAKKHYKKATFLPMNMTEIGKLNHKFGLVFSIGNVISHLSKFQLLHFIKGVYKILYKHGYWIFQVVNWDFILREQEYKFPEKKIEREALTFTRKYRDISEFRVFFKTTLKSEERIIFSEEIILYPTKAKEYISLHKNAGFKLVGHYGDFHKTAYKADLNKANILVFQK